VSISLPFFKFFIHDWLQSERIALMEHAQIGAYIMLLAKCWAHESCSLPQQPQILKTMINWRGTDEDFIPVLACFKPLTRGSQRLTNPRLYAEWLEAKQRTEMLSESGQKGAAKRWAAPAKPVTLNGSKSGNTWDAYLEAYQRRYHVDPVRNKTINSHLTHLVDRLGADEAPQVAAFYLTHNKPFYVSARHPTNLLLRDAEGLRTEWATGIKATTSEAKNAEIKDEAREQLKRVRANMEARKHGST